MYNNCKISALKSKNDEYCTEREARKPSTAKTHRLGWEVDELQRLLDDCQWIMRQLNELKQANSDENVPRRLTDLRQKMEKFVKGVTTFKRTPATHIAVYMISDEHRRKKTICRSNPVCAIQRDE